LRYHKFDDGLMIAVTSSSAGVTDYRVMSTDRCNQSRPSRVIEAVLLICANGENWK